MASILSTHMHSGHNSSALQSLTGLMSRCAQCARCPSHAQRLEDVGPYERVTVNILEDKPTSKAPEAIQSCCLFPCCTEDGGVEKVGMSAQGCCWDIQTVSAGR